MPLEFNTTQIANDAITAAKIELNAGTYAFTSNATLTWAGTVTGATDLATKQYVDNTAAGLHWKDSVKAATTAELAATYNDGAVITLTGTGVLSLDGQAIALNDRVLVKDGCDTGEAADGTSNGIYYCSTAGAVGVAAILTRATDMDAGTEFPGAAMFVRAGTTQADSGYVCTNDAAPTIGVTAIAFVQFTGGGQVVAGDGLLKSGNTLSVVTDGSSIEINADALRVKALGITSAMLAGSIANGKLTNSSVTVTAGAGLSGGGAVALGGSTSLAVGVDGASIEVTGDTLNVKALGVTSAMLAGSIANGKLTSSTISGVSLGGTLGQLSKAANSGLVMTNYTGAAAVADLAVDINALQLGATVTGSADKIAFWDATDSTSRVATLVNFATGIAGTGLTATAGQLGLTSNTISGIALGGTLQALTASANSGVTLTSYTGTAAVSDVALDVNGLLAATATTLATDKLAIYSNADSSVRSQTMATYATAQAGAGITATGGVFSISAGGVGSAELADDAVQIAEIGMTPNLDTPAVNGSTLAFNLAVDITNTAMVHPMWVVAYVNGQRAKGLTSGNPADSSEYKVTRAGTTTTVTFGANLAATDILQIQYLS